jgi:DNA-binding CsgD family transcriptional regulator
VDDLLERDRELGSVEELIEEAAAGDGRVVLLEGPAGIGKTRLLAEARRLGEGVGMRVLSARSSELEREFPYGVVRQLFEPLLVDPAAREELLSGAAASAGAVFGSPGDREAEAADASFAILHGLYWLTVNLTGEGPLLLAIDDLHWCDRPSLRFLAFLVRRLEGLPVAIACTLRDSEPGTDPTLLGELVHDQATRPIRPVPLSREAVHELIREQLGEGAELEFSAACHQAVGGNPLLLRQLLRALESEGVSPSAPNAGVVTDVGPRAVSRTVLVRLSRLSDEAVRVARAAAVLGDGAELPALARQADVPEAAAAAAIGELARTEILRSEPPISFVHPLVREAIYQDLPAGERELRHERAARALVAVEAPPEQVATHLLHVPRRGEAWVVETLRAAAGSAVAKGAAESAVSYLRRALEEPPAEDLRPRILFELGSAEALTSGLASIQYLREARAGLDDEASRAIAANVLTRNLMIAGSPEAAAEVAREAAAELPPELAHLRGAFESLAYAAVFFGVGDFSTLEELEEVRAPGAGATVGEKLLAAMAAYWGTYRCRVADECAEIALASLSGDYELFDTDNSIVSIGAIMPLVYADREEAMAAWEVSAREAHRRGSTFDISGVHLWRGATLLHRGELVDAEADLRAAVEDQRVFGSAEIARSYTAGLLAVTLLERGDREAAAAALAVGDDPAASGTDGRRFWLEGRLALLLVEDRHEEAAALAEELRDRYTWALNPVLARWRSGMARALDRLDRRDEAVALLEEELELARRYGAPGTLGRVLRELGTLEREQGEARLEEALQVLEGSPARLELAKAHAAYGTAMRLARRPKESRQPLRRALELAEACGAAPLEAHVRSELAAAGARPRNSALSGIEALTASERRVASLAAAGGTNRDIAQELFVTPKTVEVHLSNTYRKLGISSRRELPAGLAPA